jgi:hypothetical protein
VNIDLGTIRGQIILFGIGIYPAPFTARIISKQTGMNRVKVNASIQSMVLEEEPPIERCGRANYRPTVEVLKMISSGQLQVPADILEERTGQTKLTEQTDSSLDRLIDLALVQHPKIEIIFRNKT